MGEKIIPGDAAPLYPLDAAKEPVTTALVKALLKEKKIAGKDRESLEGDVQTLQEFNPERKDYLVARLSADGKEVRDTSEWYTLPGHQIRSSYVLVHAYEHTEVISKETRDLMDKALRAHPLYETLKSRPLKEILAATPIPGEKHEALIRDSETRKPADKAALRERLLQFAVAVQVDKDVKGTWRAKMMLEDARRIQAERSGKKPAASAPVSPASGQKDAGKDSGTSKPPAAKPPAGKPTAGAPPAGDNELNSLGLDALDQIRSDGLLLAQAMSSVNDGRTDQPPPPAGSRKGGLAA